MILSADSFQLGFIESESNEMNNKKISNIYVEMNERSTGHCDTIERTTYVNKWRIAFLFVVVVVI
jgi:hypothetical protein